MTPARDSLESLAVEAATAGLADRTIVNVRSVLNSYVDFCRRARIPPFPLGLDNVAPFLSYKVADPDDGGEGFSSANLGTWLSNLKTGVRLARCDPEMSDDTATALTQVMKGLKRKYPAKVTNRTEISEALLRVVLDADSGRRPADDVAAGVALSWQTFLRPGSIKDLAARDVIFAFWSVGAPVHEVRVEGRPFAPSDAYRIAYLIVQPYITKTRQGSNTSRGAIVTLRNDYLDASSFLIARCAAATDLKARLFPPNIDAAMTRRIREKLTAAGVPDAGRFGAGGLRAGGMTAATAAGLDEGERRRQGDWRSEAHHVYTRPTAATIAEWARVGTLAGPGGR